MRNPLLNITLTVIFLSLFCSSRLTLAQNTEEPLKPNTAAAVKKITVSGGDETKKNVQSATINLQTTVTGSQEQPRVLYILPWQSPATDNVDFESVEAQQKAAFNHIEREELRRELESTSEQ